MCVHIIVKGSVCSVCFISLFVEPVFPGYAPGYYPCSGCISLSRVFAVEEDVPTWTFSVSVTLYPDTRSISSCPVLCNYEIIMRVLCHRSSSTTACVIKLYVLYTPLRVTHDWSLPEASISLYSRMGPTNCSLTSAFCKAHPVHFVFGICDNIFRAPFKITPLAFYLLVRVYGDSFMRYPRVQNHVNYDIKIHQMFSAVI
jgi:hypothetical protein